MLYAVVNLDCWIDGGADCELHRLHYSLCQFFLLMGCNRGTLHLFSSSSCCPSLSRLSLYNACALMSEKLFKTSCLFLCTCPHFFCLLYLSNFLDIPLLFLIFLPLPSLLSKFSLIIPCFIFFLCICLSLSLSLPLSHPWCLDCLCNSASSPSPSHSGTQLSDMAVNRITPTQSEFGIREHLFKAIVQTDRQTDRQTERGMWGNRDSNSLYILNFFWLEWMISHDVEVVFKGIAQSNVPGRVWKQWMSLRKRLSWRKV